MSVQDTVQVAGCKRQGVAREYYDDEERSRQDLQLISRIDRILILSRIQMDEFNLCVEQHSVANAERRASNADADLCLLMQDFERADERTKRSLKRQSRRLHREAAEARDYVEQVKEKWRTSWLFG